MTFSEVDQRYITLKERFAAGEITAEQFDDELLNNMVQDAQGRWWAKARLSGEWHYYDATTEAWTRADPPTASSAPELLIPPVTKSIAQQPSQPALQQSANQQPVQSQASQAGTAPVIPASGTQTPAGTSAQGLEQAPVKTATGLRWAKQAPKQANATIPAATPATAVPAPRPASTSASDAKGAAITAPGSGASVKGVPVNYDFRPVPELSGIKKALFYLLALCIPIAGIVLFFVYRKKPVVEDRKAARMFLLLGVISILFAGLCLPAYTATGFLIFQGGSF